MKEIKIFIASSGYNKYIADLLQRDLENEGYDVHVWKHIFELSNNTLDSLINIMNRVDFGIFVFAKDDEILVKNESKKTVRDNVLFELGLFMGKLGKKRCFILSPINSDEFHIASDLDGFTVTKYDPNKVIQHDSKSAAALNTSCTEIKMSINSLVGKNSEGYKKEIITYPRARCRYINARTKYFKELTKLVLHGSYNQSNLEKIKNKYTLLKSEYEKTITYGYLHEKIGRIEKMKNIFSENKFSGNDALSCFIALGIAYEKLGQIKDAIHCYHSALYESNSLKITNICQFNLYICFEKLGSYEKLDFSRFISNTSKNHVFFDGERLIDKALLMHLIVCTKRGMEFAYSGWLEESLEYLENNSLEAFIKMKLMICEYNDIDLKEKDIEDFYSSISEIDINSRVSLIVWLIRLTKTSKYPEIISKLERDIANLKSKVNSYSVDIWADEL